MLSVSGQVFHSSSQRASSIQRVLWNKLCLYKEIWTLTWEVPGSLNHWSAYSIRNRPILMPDRVFTFGIGDGCSTELVRDVARARNGRAIFVKDNDRLQSKVMSVLRCSMTRGITDVSLQWNLPKDCCVPEQVPAIFPGEKTILYAVLSGNIPKDHSNKNSLKLTGKAGEKTIEFSLEFDFNSDTLNDVDDSFPLHRLAAKTKLSEMELQRMNDTVVTTLRLEVNILCKYTAFVGVDKDGRRALVLGPSPILRCAELSFGGISSFAPMSCTLMGSAPKKSYGLSCFGSQRKSSGSPRSYVRRKSSRSTGLGNRISNFFSSVLTKKKLEKKQLPPTSDDLLDCGLEEDSDNERDSESAGGHGSSKMVKLIEKQKFDGSWTLDEALCGILNTELQKIKEPAVVKDLDVWTTALIIEVFRKEFAEYKAEWKMIEEKALKWLNTKDLEGKDVVQEAMIFLTM